MFYQYSLNKVLGSSCKDILSMLKRLKDLNDYDFFKTPVDFSLTYRFDIVRLFINKDNIVPPNLTYIAKLNDEHVSNPRFYRLSHILPENFYSSSDFTNYNDIFRFFSVLHYEFAISSILEGSDTGRGYEYQIRNFVNGCNSGKLGVNPNDLKRLCYERNISLDDYNIQDHHTHPLYTFVNCLTMDEIKDNSKL